MSEKLDREIILTLTKNQYDYLKRWFKKQTYVSKEKVEKLQSRVYIIYQPTKVMYATFTVVIDDDTPYEWWKENIPFGFIVDHI